MPFSLSSAIRCPYRGGVSPNCRATHLCLLLVHLTSPRIVTPFAFTSDGPSRSWSIQKGINISTVNVTWSSSSAKSLQQCDKHRHHRTQPVPIFCILRVCTCEQLQLKHEVALQRCILTQAFCKVPLVLSKGSSNTCGHALFATAFMNEGAVNVKWKCLRAAAQS